MNEEIKKKETFFKRRVNISGKAIPITLIALILVAGIGTATLLTYYGTIIGTTIVEQSVLVNGVDYTVTTTDTGRVHTLKNNAEVPVTVKFETDQQSDHPLRDGDSGDIAGITTTYRGVLELTTKTVVFGSSPWTTTADKTATIWYTLTGTTFNWEYISSNGFEKGEYTLIYYKDNSNRFNNPAAAITVTGIIGDLPYATDGNLDEYGYCSGDTSTGESYAHCHGAKLWLVPTTCLNGNSISWNIATCASNYLFETDLIAYSANGLGELTLPANGGGVNFEIVNDFDVRLYPGTYTITTNVVPV